MIDSENTGTNVISRRELIKKGICLLTIISPLLNNRSAAAINFKRNTAPLIKELDLRTKIETDTYFIVISGRKPSLLPEKLTGQNFSLGGHAYVGWGREDPSSLQSYANSFGFFPVVDSLGKWSLILGPIPGETRREIEKEVDYRLICRVNPQAYEKANEVRVKWEKKGEYQLLFEDCATFVGEVAATLGLKIPERGAVTPTTWFPFGFIDAVIAANPQRNFLSGIWESTDPSKRWRLEISGNECNWIERNTTDGTLRRTVKVMGDIPPFRIERDNDTEVLQFSGARTSVIPGILALAPKPSYMILSRPSVTNISAEWNGLKWTLDPQGKLTGIKQPGAEPKPFSFNRVKS